MNFLVLLAIVVALWLLWTIARNTADALDRQAAIQYELASLDRRLNELREGLAPSDSEGQNRN